MIERSPNTPEGVSDAWLEACAQALASSEHAEMLAYPDLAQLALSGAWLYQQLEHAGWPVQVARMICRSHGELWRQLQRDPWEIAVATLEAVLRNPPPPHAPGDPMPALVVVVHGAEDAEKPNDYGVF